jgi:hypothetical protein
MPRRSNAARVAPELQLVRPMEEITAMDTPIPAPGIDDDVPGRQPAPAEPPPLDHAPVPPLTTPDDTEGG